MGVVTVSGLEVHYVWARVEMGVDESVELVRIELPELLGGVLSAGGAVEGKVDCGVGALAEDVVEDEEFP